MASIRVLATGTAAGLITLLLVAVVHPGQEVGPLLLTPASLLLAAFVLTMGWLVAAYAARNLRGHRRQGRFASLLAVALVSLVLAVTADALVLMAVGWTVSGLAVAGLVAHSGTDRARRSARRVAGRLLVGDVALWAGVAVAVASGSVERSALQPGSWVVPALLVVAGVVRSALVPAWRWLPLTAEAPSPVSALLHAGVVNGLGVLVVLLWPLFAAAPAVLVGLLVVGTATAVVGTAAVRVRPDVKGRLASSTSAQMGYMAIQIGLGLPAFALLHLIGHGFYKAWLFLRAGGATRREPAPPLTFDRPLAFAGTVALAAALAVAVVLAALSTWRDVPVVDLVPIAVAVSTGAVALTAVVRPDRATAIRSTVVGRRVGALLVLCGLAAYVVGLGWWARAFPFPGVWDGAAAVAVVTGVAVAGTVGMVAVARGLLRARLLTVVVDTGDRLRGNVVAPPSRATTGSTRDVTAAAVEAAARTVGPVWPLHSAVAVNPLAGLQDRPFTAAAEVAAQAWGARAFLPEGTYAAALRAGRFTPADLVAAAAGLGEPPDVVADYLLRRADWVPSTDARAAAEAVLADVPDEQLVRLLPARRSARSLAEVAGVADRTRALSNAWTAIADAGRPCAGGLWTAFRTDVRDLGLTGLRAAVAALPADPVDALDVLLDGVVPTAERSAYLSRLLGADPGWAARLVQRDPALVADLLALRSAFDVLGTRAVGPDVAALPSGQPWDRDTAVDAVAPVVDLLGVTDADRALSLAALLDEPARQSVWQRAWEQRYRNRLVDRVTARAAEPPVRTTDTAAQVVACIDVRSERLRRHLEAVGPYETFGFAGFFGLALRHRTASGAVSDQCPVLLSPAYDVDEDDRATGSGAALAVRGGLVTSAARPAHAFAVAEGLGLLAGLDAVVQTAAPAAWSRWRRRTVPDAHGRLELRMTVAQRTDAAAGMLRAIGLVDGFAPIVLLVGHAATVENNAFAAAYDCGACGGHGGHVNARAMATILNDPEVRERLLREHDIRVPAGTVAVAAWHDTTTDKVTVNPADVPAGHQRGLDAVLADLARAQQAALAERLADLPGVRGSGTAAALRRAGDWAEPQPEWGLAGNAAFVVGPRSMTRGLNLRGRVFLHSYEPTLDPDLSTLELILTAPTVVTQWINNQYYFSTVDPARFGAGDKTTHNVMGDYGVVTGAGGDLRVGLPWQGLFRRQPVDGSPADVADLVHEPLRLQVLLYARPADVSAVLDRHPEVADLVAHEWIAMAAVDPGCGQAHRLGTDLRWQPWVATLQSREDHAPAPQVPAARTTPDPYEAAAGTTDATTPDSEETADAHR